MQARPQGKIIYLRHTDDEGRAHMLGHVFKVQEHRVHRLVRADADRPVQDILLLAASERTGTASARPANCRKGISEHDYNLPARG